MQFTINSTYTLRAVSITEKNGGLKASEPSQNGIAKYAGPTKDAPACRAVAVEAAGGGEWWCNILALESDDVLHTKVRVHPNKVAGAEAATAYLNRQPKAAGTNGTTKKPADPLARFQASIKAVAAAEAALKAAKDEQLEAAKALQHLADEAEKAKELIELQEMEQLEAASA